jgi:hypothetical protein
VARDTVALCVGLSQQTARFPLISRRFVGRGWRVTAPRACPRSRALSLVVPRGWRPRVARDTPSRGRAAARSPASLGVLDGTCVAARALPRDGDPDPARVAHAPMPGHGPCGTARSTLAASAARSPQAETTCGTRCSAAELGCCPSWRHWHRAEPPHAPTGPTKPQRLAVPPATPSSKDPLARGPTPGTTVTGHQRQTRRTSGTTDIPKPQSPQTGHRHRSTVTGDQ